MLTIPLSSPAATLETAGGKGASLARLARLGMPVPDGFIVTTQAYRRFVAANGLEPLIAQALEGSAGSEAAAGDLAAGDLAAAGPAALDHLERLSAHIRAAFSAGQMPDEIAAAVTRSYRALDPQPAAVAVRSSATTEDLPELSFAGQQDTFLNIAGQEAVLRAIVDCWSSLWTARAIGYRLRNRIPHTQASLAVVVQRLVESDVSGVLFTANPLTGLRSEAVIDAAFGLGEALVSGQVEPDHFVAEASTGEIKQVTLGAKATATRPRPGGGVESVGLPAGTEPGQVANRQTLDAQQVRRLAAAGRQIEQAAGAPQDIEWAYAGGQLYILQARPVTSLFPIPRLSFDPLIVWFSFGAFQGVVGPLTPLGQESIQRVALGMGQKLGLSIPYEQQQVMEAAGERLWVNFSGVLRHPLGRRVLMGFLGIAEPGSVQTLRRVIDDPRLGAGQGRLRWSPIRRGLGFVRPALKELPRLITHPEQVRPRFDAQMQSYLQTVRIPGGADRFERLANFAVYLAAQGGLAEVLPLLLQRFMPLMGPSLALLKLIDHLLPASEGDGATISMSALDVTRGLPGNVTTEMDLALWDCALQIKADPPSAQAFAGEAAATLADRYLDGSLPPAAQLALSDFMQRYGMRGPGEVDLGQPRWREDPAPVIQTLQSYLHIPEEASPRLVFERSARAAQEAIERMAAAVHHGPFGWLKERLLRAAARRVRLLLGARESPKFYAVRVMGIERQTLLEIGAAFAAAGTLARPDDLFYLHVSELAALARQEPQDWRALVAQRRQTYANELRRRQVPRLLLSDGRAFYEGVGMEGGEAGEASAAVITGSPVSPGVVEGTVRVVLDPRQARLAPGEILVCPGTDPAWTPLFMAAGGLVMEVGGMMTHGSVVAREYGIPAVVGVPQATQRLHDGQRIRMDGNTGRIVIISSTFELS